jgi:hypothetical protein
VSAFKQNQSLAVGKEVIQVLCKNDFNWRKESTIQNRPILQTQNGQVRFIDNQQNQRSLDGNVTKRKQNQGKGQKRSGQTDLGLYRD